MTHVGHCCQAFSYILVVVNILSYLSIESDQEADENEKVIMC